MFLQPCFRWYNATCSTAQQSVQWSPDEQKDVRGKENDVADERGGTGGKTVAFLSTAIAALACSTDRRSAVVLLAFCFSFLGLHTVASQRHQ